MRGGFFSFTVLLAFSWCHVTALYICQHYAYNKLLRARASITQPVHRDWQHLAFSQLNTDQVHLSGQGKRFCLGLWE